MRKTEPVLDNEMNKTLWDFEKQTDYLIPTRRTDLVLIKKKEKCNQVHFAVQADHGVGNKRKQKHKRILGPCLRGAKVVEHEGDDLYLVRFE